MVLLVGATGQVGSRIGRELLSKGVRVRALCRPSSGYGALKRMGAEVAFGDLRDPASLEAACAGADTVVTTANAVRRGGADTLDAVDRQGTTNLIAAAKQAGVGHFIYMSAIGADEKSPVPLLAAKGKNETTLRDSGLTWTILSPNLFMESWVSLVVGGPAIDGRPVVVIGEGRTRHTFIAEHDVVAFAVAAVNNAAAANRHLTIGGPEALSWRDVIATYERVLGRAIDARFEAPGYSGMAAPAAVQALLAAIDHHETDFDTSALATEFGVQQTPMHAWVRASIAMSRPRI